MNSEILLAAACFAFVNGDVFFGGWWFLREPKQRGSEPAVRVFLDAESEPEAGALEQLLERLGGLLPSNDAGLRVRLSAAGYRQPSAATLFIGVRVLAAGALGALLFLFAIGNGQDTGAGLLSFICGCGFGFMLPDRVLEGITKRRQARLRRALPAAMDLIVLGLEAGQPLDQAMQDTARELKPIYPDLSGELAFTATEQRSGVGRSQALDALARRNNELELRKLVNLLIDGDRFGTSLAPAMRSHARYLRLRRKQSAQEQARKVGVKLVFPVFFLIFPAVLLVTLGPAVIQLMQHLAPLMGGE
jgi:tight adherence protein C